VNTVFLHGNNEEEEIYMVQPEGFSGKRRSHMVVEEELVWAPRQWSKKFDKFMVDRYLSIPVVGADEPPSVLAAALGGL
jgi:hypothetical protein